MSSLNHGSHISESLELNIKLFKLIRENRLVKFLNTYHYIIYNYSPFDIGKQNKFYYMDGYFSEKNFLSRTFFAIIFRNLEDQKLIKTNLSIFKKVEQVPLHFTKLPMFVYAHIMMPHLSYYFDENGNIKPQSYSGSSAVVMDDILRDKNKYRSQLI